MTARGLPFTGWQRCEQLNFENERFCKKSCLIHLGIGGVDGTRTSACQYPSHSLLHPICGVPLQDARSHNFDVRVLPSRIEPRFYAVVFLPVARFLIRIHQSL